MDYKSLTNYYIESPERCQYLLEKAEIHNISTKSDILKACLDLHRGITQKCLLEAHIEAMVGMANLGFQINTQIGAVYDSDRDTTSLAITDYMTNKLYAYLYWYPQTFAQDKQVFIAALRVDPDIGRRGVGTKLVRMCELIGVGIGASTAALLWVEKDSWMHAWYKRLGYNDLVPHENPGFIWMQKKLVYF